MPNLVECPGNLTVNVGEKYSRLESIFLRDIATFEKFCYPTWLAIGIPGSILTIIIWSRKSMRRNGSFAASIFQASLGFVDLCFLTVYMLFYLHINQIAMIMDSPMCRIYPLITYVLQYVTPLLNLSIILERYIAVKYPFNNNKFFGRSKTSAIFVLSLCTGISTAFSCSSAFFFFQNETTGKCVHILETIENLYIFYWTVILEVLFFGIIPLICLIFNILLAIILKGLVAKQLQPVVTIMGRSSSTTEPSNSIVKGDFMKTQKNAALSSTITLVCVSFFLIFAHLSVAISMIFTYSLEKGDICLSEERIREDPTWQKYFLGYKTKSIIESVCFSHSALKIFVYFATSQMFRKEFVKLLHCFSESQEKTLISANTKKSNREQQNLNNPNSPGIQDLELIDSYPKTLRKQFISVLFKNRNKQQQPAQQGITLTTPQFPRNITAYSDTPTNIRRSRQMSKTVFNEFGERVLVT